MKKMCTLLLALMMVLSLAACGDSGTAASQNTDNAATSTATDASDSKDTKKADKTDEKLSVEQESALNKAEEYLNMMAFSHDSLIDQLKFEGFSEEDATYAAENCGLKG